MGQLKKAIKESAINNIGFKSNNAPRKPWITNEMTMKMEERGQWKNNKTKEVKTKYKKLNNELRRATDKAREEWW